MLEKLRSRILSLRLTPGLLAGGYALLGAIWILAIRPMIGVPEQPLVDLAFILITSALLYVVARAGLHALGESERVLTTLMQNLPGMAYRCRNDQAWTMLFVSGGCEPLTGYAPAQLLENRDLSYEELILPPDRDRVRSEIEAALAAHRPFELEYRIRTAEGEEKWVWERGVAVRGAESGQVLLEGFITDITERRRAEQVNTLLATAVEHAGEGIMITDSNGTILYVNPAFERITGYSPEEAVGRNPRILKSGEHDESFYGRMWATLTEGRVWSGRVLNRKKDGTLYEERQTISPVKDAQGRTVNYVAIKRDVTEIVALEAQLRHSQKMEAVGKLAGGIAHDFNNLLMAIMGHCELLYGQLGEDSPERDDVDEIKKSCKRASALTRQLLTFSRRQAVRPRLIDLNLVVSDMKNMLERLIGADIELVTRLDPELGMVRADASQIEQVIMNLAVNARDAMVEGGRLVIETRCIDLGHRMAAQTGLASGRYAMMTFTDTGAGIRPAIQQRVFEPFFSTKSSDRGTGLGLSTVYGIVKQSGGHIALDSQPGQGTRFRIYLPQDGEGANGTIRSAEDTYVPGRTPRNPETILVVDSAGPVRSYTEEILERAGYVVLEADDLAAATEICAEYPGSIALVVSDLSVAGLDPEDVRQKLARLRPGLRVLCLARQQHSLEARPDGPNGVAVLPKPFAPERLLDVVRALLDRPVSSLGRSPS